MVRRAAFSLVPRRTATATENININNSIAVPPVFFPTKYWKSARFTLNCPVLDNDSDDTFDFYLQSGTRVGGGNEQDIIWDDFVHFTQVVGNASEPIQHIASWFRDYTPEDEMKTPSSAALSAGTVLQGPIGEHLRLRLVVVDPSGSDASVTYEIMAEIDEEE